MCESSHKQRLGRLEGILIQTSLGSVSFGETLLLISLLSTFFPPPPTIFPASPLPLLYPFSQRFSGEPAGWD